MRTLKTLLAVLVSGLLVSSAAVARQILAADGSPTAQCLLAAQGSGVLENIPDGLMRRLAQVESGRPMPGETEWRPWPWTIDADGADLVFATKAQAVAWAASAPRRGVKFLDAGCLQVNLQYHRFAFADLQEAFDPWTNARYAARYLRSLYEEAGHDWSIAVGWYHSHSPDLAYDYRARVAALGEGIIVGLPPGTLAARLHAIGVIGVPLAGGGVLRIQLNRQPTGAGYHRPSACSVAAALGPLMVTPPRLAGCGRARVVAGGPRRVAAPQIAGP